MGYWLDPRRPRAAVLSDGWWAFSDQGKYLTDTLAWAAGDLRPAQHWYLPGYPLLGVPFTALTPADPWLVPDAACLLLSLWLTAAIAATLAPRWRWSPLIGAGSFALAAAQPTAMTVWVTPWTTTPAAPLLLGGVLALLRFQQRPRTVTALAAGLCAGALAAFRPADAAMLGVIAACVIGLSLAGGWPGWRTAWRAVAAVAIGVAVPAVVTALLYTLVYGVQLSPYLSYSAELGFEPRLLPLQWVTLVLDPHPMLPGGEGLIAVFPYIAAGLAGMAACLVAPPAGGSRAAHAVMIAAALGYGALYLCYRDLHPQGLWGNYNYHYFKWLLPVFALYTVLGITRWRRPGAWLAAAAVLLAVLPWRAEVTALPEPGAAAALGHRLDIPDGLGIGTGLAAAATGRFSSITDGNHNFYFGDHWYGAAGSIATYPVPGGLLLAPLRPLAPGPGHVDLDPAVTVDPAFAPQPVAFRLVYGWPCFLRDCRPDGVIPPPTRAAGVPIAFDDAVSPLLVDGWSPAGPDELWTRGGRAALRVRFGAVPPNAVLTVELAAFVPPGSPPLDVVVRAGGREIAQWRFADAAPQTRTAPLPADAFGPGNTLSLGLVIANPRRPADWIGGPDERLLGLRIRSITIGPAQ